MTTKEKIREYLFQWALRNFGYIVVDKYGFPRNIDLNAIDIEDIKKFKLTYYHTTEINRDGRSVMSPEIYFGSNKRKLEKLINKNNPNSQIDDKLFWIKYRKHLKKLDEVRKNLIMIKKQLQKMGINE